MYMASVALFKLERMRVYYFDTLDEFNTVLQEIIENKEYFDISLTNGKKYYKKFSKRIDNEDGDNINSYKNENMIEITRKKECTKWFHISNKFVLIFFEHSLLNEVWNKLN